jgi:mevalonate pyrophosphate decarboxylase
MASESDIESVIEQKLRENLKWSMVFFAFNHAVADLESKHSNHNKDINKDFFKNWKKHTCDHLVKKDLEAINSILNSPKNIFHSTLQNAGENIESTELYQEKYNSLFKKVEEFYFHNVSGSENNED